MGAWSNVARRPNNAQTKILLDAISECVSDFATLYNELWLLPPLEVALHRIEDSYI